MKPTTRVILGALARVLFLGFAAWIALAPDALPGAPPITRIAVASLFLGFAILLGEVVTLRSHLAMLVGALRAGGASAGARAGRDDKAAIDVLVRALAGSDGAAREKAWKHLRRLTGQDLPLDAGAWATWWASHREAFPSDAARETRPGRGDGA